MKTFIRLHSADTNNPVVVNTSNIALIDSIELNETRVNSQIPVVVKGKKTVIYLITPVCVKDGATAAICVNENVEKVYDQIYSEQ